MILLKNDKILNIRHIVAEEILTVDELSFGCEIQIFQGCDMIRTIHFEKIKQNVTIAARDRQLVDRLRCCKSGSMPIPHSIAAAVVQLKQYTLTKQWLLSQLRLGRIDRDAYLILISAVNQKKG